MYWQQSLKSLGLGREGRRVLYNVFPAAADAAAATANPATTPNRTTTT